LEAFGKTSGQHCNVPKPIIPAKRKTSGVYPGKSDFQQDYGF